MHYLRFPVTILVVKKIELGDSAQKLMDKMEAMDEEELLRISQGVTIEGEAEVVH